jgi:predicted alpha/beta superfamily hydrolase
MAMQHQPVTISNTELHIVSSEIVGDQFRICVALPKNYADTTKRYPVVYLLDANIFFGLMTDTARLLQFGHEIPELILVGIGYPDDDQHLTLRNRDYGPTPYDMPEIAGGAEHFLAFLQQELQSYLEEQYRIDSEDRVLVGDSTSGLFALYTLFHQPEAFRRYIIGSPSIYWDDAVTFEYEARYAARHTDLPATVFLSVGALEAIFEPGFAAMVSNVAKLTETLTSREYPSLNLISHIFDNETHLSVIPATMSRGLRAVFTDE